MSSAVTWAVQNFAIAQVSHFSKDPNTIALVSSIIVSVVGWVMCNYKALFNRVSEYARRDKQALQHTVVHSIFIPQKIPDDTTDAFTSVTKWNLLFKAVAWYLTQSAKVCARNSTAIKSKNQLHVLPAVNCEHKHVWNDFCIFIVMVDVKEEQSHQVGIELKGIDAEQLRKFVDFCDDQYKKHTERNVWRQRLFTHGGYYNEWKPELTHNTKTWDTVVLPADMKATIVQEIDLFMNSEAWYTSKGIAWTRGLLLYGQAGCGKTSIIKAISNVYQMDVYSFKLHEIKSDETLDELFKQIPARSVVVMEDVDAMGDKMHARKPCLAKGKKKIKNEEEEVAKGVTLNGVLNALDGVANAHGRILIMTTNHKEVLDPALLRPGRCDLHLHLGLCTCGQIQEMIKVFLGVSCKKTFPDNVLSPAEVSSILLRNRLNADAAIEIICSTAKNLSKS